MSVSYQTTPDVEDLIHDNLKLVKTIAWQLHGRVSAAIELEDLIQIGYYGLVSAAQKYKQQKDATFASYAGLRIRGAMVDHLRKNSNLCRTTIKMRQQYNAAEAKLTKVLQSAPSDEEIAAEMNINMAEYQEWQKAFAANTHESIDQAYDDYSMWFATPEQSPEEALSQKDLKKLLLSALETLPEKLALVIQLYYVEELNIYEIAEILEITTGWVSQIKKQAITALRDHIAAAQESENSSGQVSAIQAEQN